MGKDKISICKEPVFSSNQIRIFFDGIFSEPRLSHPECVAIGPDDHIWCGTETGDIVRLRPDGTAIELIASTGGFILGLAFHRNHSLYICDQKYAAIYKLDLKTKDLKPFSSSGIRIPNYPLIDSKYNRLFVSDSYASQQAGPGIWAYDLDTGQGSLWYDHPMHFANGLAMRRDEDSLYVCETFAYKVTRIPILEDGSAGSARVFSSNLPGLPDGIAFDRKGQLVVACYEPSRLLRISNNGRNVEILAEDKTAHLLCHPTNIAFNEDRLFIANLSSFHCQFRKMAHI